MLSTEQQKYLNDARDKSVAGLVKSFPDVQEHVLAMCSASGAAMLMSFLSQFPDVNVAAVHEFFVISTEGE